MARVIMMMALVGLVATSWIENTLAQEGTKVAVPPAAVAMYDKLEEHTLENGLRVYLLPVARSPVVTMMTAYKVGACDEDKSATGLSHYLEHLMFKGTAKFMPGDIDRFTQRNGGSNNAYTTEDMTNYHFDFAADRWEAALDIEAERMRGLVIDAKHEFEQEKGAVIEELARNEDQPGELEYKALLPILFGKQSPYGHPVIGEREHVRGATAGVIKGYYDRWYHPNNAALVVVGGIEPKSALAKIKEKLGAVPAGKLPERKAWTTSYPPRPARTEFPSKFPTPRLLMGYVTVVEGHADEAPLDVAAMVLAGGKSSRLYKKLVLEERLALDVGASHDPGRYPGWFGLTVVMIPGQDRAKAEQIVLEELRRLGREPATAAEVIRGQRLLLAQTIFARESVHQLADSIARKVMSQPVSALKDELQRWAAVTPVEVQRVAKQYLNPEGPVVVWSVPPSQPQTGGGSAGAPAKPGRRAVYRQDQATIDGWHGDSADSFSQGVQSPQRNLRGTHSGGTHSRRTHTRGLQDTGGATPVSLKQSQTVKLPNGLTVLFMENHRLPIVVAATSLRWVRRHEPAEKAGLATLMGNVLEEGTTQRTGPQIAETIENLGGSLDLSARTGSVKVLTEDRKLGLEVLFDCLLHPTFPAEAFARKKQEQLADIAEAMEQPDIRGAELFNETIYAGHYLGRPARGKLETVEKLTREDCMAFHKQVMVPENMTVAVVGDFNTQEMVAELTRLTSGWTGKLPGPPAQPELMIAPGTTTRFITMPNAAQLQFFMGHLGIRRNNPDYFKLMVMDYVLGTGTGFTDRLSARLRDREGLAYTVSANVAESASEEPGLFACYIGTEARNYSRVRQIFLEEIERLRREPPTEVEVSSVKQYLLGRLAFLLTTNERIAEQLLYIHRFNLGLDYFDQYRQAVRGVTPLQVKEVAEKYLQPGKFTTVAAGAIDEKGQPLPRK
jgi:zinc protease